MEAPTIVKQTTTAPTPTWVKRNSIIFLTQFLNIFTLSSLELEDPFDLKELLPKGSTRDDRERSVRFLCRSNLG